MSEKDISIILADDHEIIREGIKTILSLEEDYRIVGEGSNGEEALQLIKLYHPKLAILDMKMPKKDGLEVLEACKKNGEKLKVIFLTVESDQATILKAISLGADGYLLKDSAGTELVSAINQVLAGDKYIDPRLVELLFTQVTGKDDNPLYELTNRELDILYHLSQGLSNNDIANELFIASKTVRNYSSRIFTKLGVDDRVQATITARKYNIEDYYKKKNR